MDRGLPSPNYTSTLVQDTLRQLATVSLADLSGEARIERCRATRDLSRCDRHVQHVLASCGHASLCPECAQRCDTCPVCRNPNNSGSRLRLYYKCIESGLISKQYDDRFSSKEGSLDIERLYLLFDVALQNNLSALICHYVMDVCLDENAVSSNPVVAFLLDEVVVKDWCKRAFKNLISDLCVIYRDGIESMKSNLTQLQKYAVQLNGICTVIDVMVFSLRENFSAQVSDLHLLLENTIKAKQHLDVMVWCTRHDFLNQVESRYSDFYSWNSQFQERKSASCTRSYPSFSDPDSDSNSNSNSSLFIEEALDNLGMEEQDSDNGELDLLLLSLKEEGSVFYPRVDRSDQYCYPFESVWSAVDFLFLNGSSDTILAKQAIFLYYLIDRHWTKPDPEWRHLIDDFATVFGITNHALTECFVFYLLDDHTPEALKEAIRLIPSIACPETHPKISQILLERQRPDSALTLMRCTGRDSALTLAPSQSPSLSEAVTAVLVRIEYGLLTEAFMYQRAFWSIIKEPGLKLRSVQILVSEMCSLCVERDFVDRIIELPWNSVEERFLQEVLHRDVCERPESKCGSFLVVYYLQRYRYLEAYQVHCSLKIIEQSAIEKFGGDNNNNLLKITKIAQWREDLVARSIELLPEAERNKVTSACTERENKINYSPKDNIQTVVHASDLSNGNADTGLFSF